MKRILILGDINSSHIQKWCSSLAQAGHDVGVFSLSFPKNKWYESFENITVFSPFRFSEQTFHSSTFSKLKYLRAVPNLKKVIQKFNPDILHAHYATSYGVIGALSQFHPYLISTWGSDLMEFPYKSFLHLKFIKYIFSKADRIFATSKSLASHAEKFTSKEISIIPFGIDTEKFKPKKTESLFSLDCIVIGSIKSLERIYGIDILIKVFAELHSKNPQLNLRLLIVGSGSKEQEYKQLVKNLQLDKLTIFTGRIQHNELGKYYNMIDIFVNVSHNESFGVSVLEASSCGLPVVVSKVGGLPEVIEENKTGFFVEAGNENNLYEVLEKLICDAELRNNLGKAGRRFVIENYEWENSFLEMTAIYDRF